MATISTPVSKRSWADIVKSSSAADKASTVSQLDARASEFVPSKLSTMKASAEEFTPAEFVPSQLSNMKATAKEFTPAEFVPSLSTMNATAEEFVPTDPVFGWLNTMNAVANVFASFADRPDAVTADPGLEFGPKWYAMNAAASEVSTDPALTDFVPSQWNLLSINPAFLSDDESDDMFDKEKESNDGDKESSKSTIDTSDAEKESIGWDKESIDGEKDNKSIDGSPELTFSRDPCIVDFKSCQAKSTGQTESNDGDKESNESTVDTNDADKESSAVALDSNEEDKGAGSVLEAEDILYAMHFPAKLPPGLSLPPWRKQPHASSWVAASTSPPPVKLPPWRRQREEATTEVAA